MTPAPCHHYDAVCTERESPPRCRCPLHVTNIRVTHRTSLCDQISTHRVRPCSTAPAARPAVWAVRELTVCRHVVRPLLRGQRCEQPAQQQQDALQHLAGPAARQRLLAQGRQQHEHPVSRAADGAAIWEGVVWRAVHTLEKKGVYVHSEWHATLSKPEQRSDVT